MKVAFDADYAYARACGSLAKSFLGERAASLARCSRVAEAWRAVFDEIPPALPEAALAAEMELRLGGRAAAALRSVAGPLVLDTPLFRALSRRREMSYLKRVLAAAAEGASAPPEPSSPGLFPDIRVEAFPDIERMLRNTCYAWIVEAGSLDLPAVKNRLDRQYYRDLWEAVSTMSAALRGSLLPLVRVEAELENVAWALRLKRYYAMDASDIGELLIDLPGADVKAPAIAALGFRSDARSDWREWKWERLVPDLKREGAGAWRLDLRALESAADAYLFRRLLRALHMESDTCVPLYSYFRIKEMEAIAIRGVVEGIKLEAPEEEIAAFASERTGGAA